MIGSRGLAPSGEALRPVKDATSRGVGRHGIPRAGKADGLMVDQTLWCRTLPGGRGSGAVGDTNRARLSGFTLYPGPRQSHEPFNLLVVSPAQENAHVGTGQAIETGKLRTGVEPIRSHCGGAGGQESLNWAGPGTPWSETSGARFRYHRAFDANQPWGVCWADPLGSLRILLFLNQADPMVHRAAQTTGQQPISLSSLFPLL